MKRVEVFPNFFILGAAKCGTTSLHAYLNQHPDICMSEPKEPFFFEAEFEEGLDFYWEKYFSHYNGEKLIGDARPRNLYLPFVSDRILSVNPDAKFILTLRNPIDRAHSQWWSGYRRQKDKLSFEDAVKTDCDMIESGVRINTPEDYEKYFDTSHKGRPRALPEPIGFFRWYIDRSYYAEHLERYFKVFPRENFKIFLFEDLVSNPQAVVKEACEFLGLDPAPSEDFDYSAHNEAKVMKWKFILRRFFKKPFGGLSSSTKPKIEPSCRKWLAEHFRPHNKRLEEIIGRNLDHWI